MKLGINNIFNKFLSTKASCVNILKWAFLDISSHFLNNPSMPQLYSYPLRSGYRFLRNTVTTHVTMRCHCQEGHSLNPHYRENHKCLLLILRQNCDECGGVVTLKLHILWILVQEYVVVMFLMKLGVLKSLLEHVHWWRKERVVAWIGSCHIH